MAEYLEEQEYQNQQENSGEIEDINKTVIDSLSRRSRKLEEENQFLKEDIDKIKSISEKGALDYYSELRKQLFNEIDGLYKKKKFFDNQKKLEDKKLKEQLTYFSRLYEEKAEQNKNLKEQLNLLEDDIKSKKKLLAQEKKVKLEGLPGNDKFEQLEYQVNSLVSEITKKDYLIKDQKFMLNELNEKLDTQTKALNDELNECKSQFHNLLGAKETLEENYDKIHDEKTKEFKKAMNKNIYNLNKKILFSKDELQRLNFETNTLENSYETSIQSKNKEILNLKNNIRDIHTNYELLYKLSSEKINEFANNYSQMKSLYIDREKDFIKISDYYVNIMSQYIKPLLDPNNYNIKLENNYHESTSKIISLQNKNEELYKMIENCKRKNIEEGAEIRKTITNNLTDIDNKIKNFETKQKELGNKMKRLVEFYNTINKKHKTIETLSKENKKLINSNKELEKKINKYYSIEDSELNDMKIKIKKIEQDLLYKDEALNNYEDMFKDDVSEMDQQDEVREDVLKRLKTQIESLESQIQKLMETKNNMDNYYSKEINNLRDKASLLINENKELKKNTQKDKNDLYEKQGKAADLWLREYKNFHENFHSLSEVENLVGKFKKLSNEIRQIKEYELEKDLKKLRSEVYLKDRQIRMIKENQEGDFKNNRKLLQEMSQNIKEKLSSYEEISNQINNITNILDGNINELKKINEDKTNFNQNELLLVEEQKKKLNKLVNKIKNKRTLEIEQLKDKIKELEMKIIQGNEAYMNSVQELKTNSDEQFKIIKDREDYINKQTDIICNNLRTMDNHGKKAVEALRQENQQLKNKNHILAKKL